MTEVRNHQRLEVGPGAVHVMAVEPEARRFDGCVVFSHGFLVPGFESRRMFIDMAGRLAAAGVQSALFDYRGSGYSDLSFEEMTLDTELEDLKVVLAAVRERASGPIIVWGMSLGTAIAARAAAEDPGAIDALAFWCGSFETYERWSERYREPFEAGGGETLIPAGFKVTERLVESTKSFDLQTHLSRTSCPLLMVHGTEDGSTDIARATRGMDRAQRDMDRVIIEGGNHGFKNQPEHYERALGATLDWIADRLM